MKSDVLRLTSRLKRIANFPAFRSSVEAVKSFYGEKEISSQRIVQVILADLGLCVQVLRAANSAFFNPLNLPMSNVSRAAILLGFEQLKKVALGAPILEQDQLKEDFVREYALSLLTAHLASCSEKDEKQAEEIYLTALFRRVTRLLLLHYAPDTYQELLSLPRPRRLELLLLLGERLLKYWNLPEPTLRALEGRELQRHQSKNLQDILIAERLALSLLNGHGLAGWKRLVDSPKKILQAFKKLKEKLFVLPLPLQEALKDWTKLDETSFENAFSLEGEWACSLHEVLPLLKGIVAAASEELNATGKLFYLEEDRLEDADGEELSPEAQKFFSKILQEKKIYQNQGEPAFMYLPLSFNGKAPFLLRFKRESPFSERESFALRFLSRVLSRLLEAQNVLIS